MSSAHFFYITIIFLVGLSVGFFLGRRALEAELKERQRRHKRREALRQKGREADEASAS